MIRINGLKFGYSKQPLFEGVELLVEDGQKAGLVGANGAGKSTLFKLITGKEMPEGGSVETKGKTIYVAQEVSRDEAMEKAKNIREYLDPEFKTEDFELRRIMGGLEMSFVDWNLNPLKLSGGQKTKLAIARALLAYPDNLLMDEPTNFLDIGGKKWIMSFLADYPGTVLLVSHDLNLLDRNIDKVLYINPQTKIVDTYAGNYSSFIKLKAQREAMLIRQIEAEQKHIKQMKEGLVKMARFSSEKGVRQRMNLKRRVEQAITKLPPMPTDVKKIKLVLPEPEWVGSLPVWIKNISKSYGTKKVLTEVNLDIKRGERVALVGVNGAGKSTLIKIICNFVEADGGEVIKDPKLKMGYYSQEFENWEEEARVGECFREKCQMNESRARPILARFLLGEDKIYQKVKSLSGGEKTRLAIAALLGQNYNLLVLDEPTTYLDVMSQRVILEALKEYRGAILIVSHTPEFLEELGIKKRLLLPENKLIENL
ncbi:MAG: ABC-F family ATP-binding cassette domain-containing protein [Candidatus Shapirobacteria bacterium]